MFGGCVGYIHRNVWPALSLKAPSRRRFIVVTQKAPSPTDTMTLCSPLNNDVIICNCYTGSLFMEEWT
jgi:hypothetical protein